MLGLPLEYIRQAKPDAILARLGLDAEGVANSVKTALATEQERLHLT
jgi:deoxyxylulose-5-phosphate synthase